MHTAVQEYYTERTLGGGTSSLQTCACISGAVPKPLRALASQLHEEVTSKFYGCGSPIPPCVEGAVVVDLGCGTGRDSFLLSKLVGPTGRVIGVDMTDAQLDVARRHVGYHMEKWGFPQPNIEFKKGLIENLADISIPDNSVDLVVSNCVINLALNKAQVFAEIFRILKPGGELFFSDVFANCRVPAERRNDAVLLGECLAGAMYLGDFRRMLNAVGCRSFRIVHRLEYDVDSAPSSIAQKLQGIRFASLTIRAFKLSELEAPPCEDFGQTATYLGTVADCVDSFTLGEHPSQVFPAQVPTRVCGNTARMLTQTRYASHFQITNGEGHSGRFPSCACSEIVGLF